MLCGVILAEVAGTALAQRPPSIGAAEVPTFRLRARVTATGAQATSNDRFTFRWSTGSLSVESARDRWSEWLPYTGADARAAFATYPMKFNRRFPMVVKLRVEPATAHTLLEVQLAFANSTAPIDLRGDLFGPDLGILVWLDQSGTARAATMAAYNKRYWPQFDANAVAFQRPKHFILIDQFVAGDDDRLNWEGGIRHLTKTGITALMITPSAYTRQMMLSAGVDQIVGGSGGMILGGPLGLLPHSESLEHWTQRLAKTYHDAAYAPSQIALFALSDEPSWYYPESIRALKKSSVMMEKFRNYLAQKRLAPADLGASQWSEVWPQETISPQATLPERRLFYWTYRFFPWWSAVYAAQTAGLLRTALGGDVRVFNNWNNFSGRYYGTGPHASVSGIDQAAIGTGAPDWFEFGSLHGGDLLWTEDWFNDYRSYQWSFYCAKLNSIARLNNLTFGGYVVVRSDGPPIDGLLQKILTIVGSGGKVVDYYTFGPEYNFPDNSYSEISGVVPTIAHANRMIAKAEDVLWPGHKAQAQVAILQPRSAEVWDRFHIVPGSRIIDTTNDKLHLSTVDYMAEIYDLYCALEFANIPVDFLDEDAVSGHFLDGYRVLYVTEPDVPVEAQRAIEAWVRRGGTLAMVPGTAHRDRYDEPVAILSKLSNTSAYARSAIQNAFQLKPSATIGGLPIFAGRVDLSDNGKVLARFDNHSPAVTERALGAGRVVSYSWFPGITYSRAAFRQGRYLETIEDAKTKQARDWVVYPVRRTQVEPPVVVNTAAVEAPMLVSPAGAAITLLNWTGAALPAITVNARVPFNVKLVESVTHGAISFQRHGSELSFSLQLGAADIVALRP